MKTEDIFSLPPEEKNQLQLERLQSTLNRACRQVDFHRRRMADHGIDPAGIETLSDIARLPFLNRADFSEHYPYDLFAVPLRDIVRIHTAPGTTRNPTVSGYTAQDLSTWRQMTARALGAAGVTPHDILQIALNPGLANWGRDYKEGAEEMGVSVIPNTPLSMEKQFMVLRDYKTTVLITTPMMADYLAEYREKSGLHRDTLSLHTVILTGETVTGEFRRSLEERLRVKVWLHYGLSDVPGAAIAFECKTRDGLHVNEDHFLPEIIHPETGSPLPAGQTGELVLTTLTTRAFPLIRFRTGDRARLLEETCPCGCTLARIEWYAHRTDDIMNIDGVSVHGRQVRHTLESTLPIGPETFDLRVGCKEGRKCLEVDLPMNNTIFSDEIKELERLLRGTENRLRENLGIPVMIRLVEPKRRS